MQEDMSGELAEQLYRSMRLIRRFEETVVELVFANEIAGVCHEYVGQEAVAVGVCAALRTSDVITSTHRGHGHIIAKGGKVRHMLAELMGRVDGYNRGRGGSMHIADVGLGIYGANGIVGAGAPMACGAAFQAKVSGSGGVAVSFFGDGAINQGVLHESLNLAAVWNLPVIFACENNSYAVTTKFEDVSKVAPHDRASAYGMPGEQVDGMDVEAVFLATKKAVARARAGEGPTLLEFETYRFCGHYSAESQMKVVYRPQEELESWQARDPIEYWAQQMIRRGFWAEDDVAAANESIDQELVEGIAFARASDWPKPADALDYMYTQEYPETPSWGVN